MEERLSALFELRVGEMSSIYGDRPLHAAAWNGHLKIVMALIAKGADMNILTNEGTSALGEARHNYHHGVDAFLRSLGAVDDGRR
jgi:ankyrin repeat protein